MHDTTTTATERRLTITRVFDAPREVVFQAWTDPDHMARWMGPAGFTATSVTIDAREGGRLRTCIRNEADGAEYWSQGTYREVTPPERLVFTFAWEEDGVLGDEMLVTITLDEEDGRTRMTFVQEGFTSVEDRDGHADGWTESFADLAAYVESV